MLGGSLRGIYSGVLILLLSVPFGAQIHLSMAFFAVMLLNGLAFSALGVTAAIVARPHGDIARFSTYVILPMPFLCNTFFPLDRGPDWVEALIRILPLTHTSSSLRALAYGDAPNYLSMVVLAAYAAVFMMIANVAVARRKNL